MREANSPVQPLYLILEYFWAKIVGDSEISLRFLSLIPGLLSIYFAFLLVQKLHSREAGCLTAYLMALSSVHAYYSIEIRMYSLVLLSVLFSIYSYFRSIESNGIRWWLAHIITTIIIVWTHVLGVFVLPCLAVHAYFFGFSRWRGRIVWTLLHSLAVFTIVPWILTNDMQDITAQYEFRQVPTLLVHDTIPPRPSVQATLQHWIASPMHQGLGPLENGYCRSAIL